MKGSRKKIAQSKSSIDKVLSFLLVHTFSSGEILQRLVGYTPAGLWKLLFKMEVRGLIVTHDISIAGTAKIRIYGITLTGVHKATPQGEVPNDYRRFEPSKFSFTTMEHNLDIQRVHLWAMEKGISFYGSKDFYDAFKIAGDKRADAVLEIKGKRVAVEVERTPKTRARYGEILGNYFREINRETFQKVWYMMPSESDRASIARVITSIKAIKVKGDLTTNTVHLTPDHWSYFDFVVHPYYEGKAKNEKSPSNKPINPQPSGGNHDAA